MKEIRTIKMVEQTEVKFIADDGKEFIGENAECKCREYERQKDKNKVKEDFERLDITEIKIPFVKWLNCESKIWEVMLESKKDYYILKDYLKIVEEFFDVNIDMPEKFPCKETIVIDCDWVGNYNGNLKEEIQKTLEQFGE